MQIESPETIDHANTVSHYLRSFEVLTSKYGENTDHDLKPTQIIEVIKASDSFLRDHCGWAIAKLHKIRNAKLRGAIRKDKILKGNFVKELGLREQLE